MLKTINTNTVNSIVYITLHYIAYINADIIHLVQIFIIQRNMDFHERSKSVLCLTVVWIKRDVHVFYVGWTL